MSNRHTSTLAAVLSGTILASCGGTHAISALRAAAERSAATVFTAPPRTTSVTPSFSIKTVHDPQVTVILEHAYNCSFGTCVQLDLKTPLGPISVTEVSAAGVSPATASGSAAHPIKAQRSGSHGQTWVLVPADEHQRLQILFVDGVEVFASIPSGITEAQLGPLIEEVY